MSNIEPTPFGDKYVLVEHIATGGMAEVYRAKYSGIEGFAKELVIKTLREEFAARDEVVGMFLDEARVAATLHHNNVVHTYDLGEIGGEYYIAMELLKGEELVNVLRQGAKTGRPIPLDIAIGIVLQALEGLHYVHARTDDTGQPLGLIHRDINPTNIHVGYDGTAKILDFGIAATRAKAVAKEGQFAGKLAYMAAEQVQGHDLDPRADLFALGVVLYEMALGRRLFRGPRDEVVQRILDNDIPAPTFVDPSFSPDLEAVIMKALALEPGDRYQNADHMFRDLEKVATALGLSASPRRISAYMSELFGEGAPAEVDYEDEYADLDDEALDFDDFDRVGGDDAEEPDWVRGVGTDSGSPKRSMTIGNLGALVAADEPEVADSAPALAARGAAGAAASATGRRAAVLDEQDASASTSARKRLPRAEGVPTKAGAGASGSRRAAARSMTSGVRTVSGRMPLTTGGFAAVSAEPTVSGRFGQSVVAEQSRKSGATFGWLVAVAIIGALAYFGYLAFTTK